MEQVDSSLDSGSTHSFVLEKRKRRQIINRVTPINTPRQPISGHRSRFENLITMVSGVRTSTPIRARKVPNRFGWFLTNFSNKYIVELLAIL